MMGYERTLEVEFRIEGLTEWEVSWCLVGLLQKFREKGRVRVVQGWTGKEIDRISW